MATVTLTSIDQVENGDLKSSLDEGLARAVQDLITHIRKHGNEATADAKAEISLKIVISREKLGKSVTEDGLLIASKLDVKTPGRPIGVSRAQHVIIQGKDTINVKFGGSHNDPRQGDLLDGVKPEANVIKMTTKDAKSRAAGEKDGEPEAGPYAAAKK